MAALNRPRLAQPHAPLGPMLVAPPWVQAHLNNGGAACECNAREYQWIEE